MRRTRLRGLALLVATLQSLPAVAAEFMQGGTYAVPVASHLTSRSAATVRQQFDFSCGSAAVATLLTYHYGTPTSEDSAFRQMLAAGDAQRIRKEGFSLLDMKAFLSSKGFEADGFELPLERLAQARIPAIVLISENGYRHFVVVKGLRDGDVLIGDPAAGTRVIERARFETLWSNKLLFVIHSHQTLASFNAQADWRAFPRAPLASAVQHDGLGGVTIPRLGPNEN